MVSSTQVSTQLTKIECPVLAKRYRAYLASSEADRLKAFRLRFIVFNLELKEGLESAFAHGCDHDDYDSFCDHLLVEDTTSGAVVGTYRMQTGVVARDALGYYSEQEFEFGRFERIRSQTLELGRACVHREHRSFEVLNLLWKGVAQYAVANSARYLIGCSSLTSQDPVEGWQVYNRISRYLCENDLRTKPKPSYALEDPGVTGELDPPKLLRAYLAIGAKICGPPAIDREFKTIDFLTLLDLNTLPESIRARYLNTR